MISEKRTKSRRIRNILLLLAGLFLSLLLGFLIYTSIYYRADVVALDAFNSENVTMPEDNLTVFSSSGPGDTALIFYPGGKVEHTAYSPLLQKLADGGVTCVLVKMPFNLAVFDSDAAGEVFEAVPDIEKWYIGGHSLGGAMASSYASENSDSVEGLILLGSYIYGDYPPESALTLYGSLDSGLEEHIDYTENIVVIDGGNHAQFGNYGEQRGDSPATISSEEQQHIAASEILDFISRTSSD